MKLTLDKTTFDRSLERRWDLTGAEPVLTHPLHPTVAFVPVDLRVWWQVGDGRWPESCRANAWPATDQDRSRHFASWDSVGGAYPGAMPQWVRDLAKTVRTDLVNNRTSTNTGAADFWGYSLQHQWTVQDADPVADRNGNPFIPADVNIWWSFYPGRPERDHRYNVYVHSAGRNDRSTAQWGGTRVWQDPDLPAWIQDLVGAQYEELAATAKASTDERNAA